jgi:hypothetical protein
MVSEVVGLEIGSLYRHTTKMEQIEEIMARLLAEIRTNRKEIRANQVQADANLKGMKGEMTARLEAKIQNNQERMEANQGKIMAKLDAHHERMMARMDSQLEENGGLCRKHGSHGRNSVRVEALGSP